VPSGACRPQVEHGRESRANGNLAGGARLRLSGLQHEVLARLSLRSGRRSHIPPLQAEEFADPAPGRDPGDDQIAEMRTGTRQEPLFFAGLSAIGGVDQSAVARRFLRE
jgi:hypothetical protein